MDRKPPGIGKIIFVVIWCAAIGAGFVALLIHDAQPGVAGTAPAAWPNSSTLPHSGNLDTLVLFLHPRCACSRATLTELHDLAERSNHKAAVDIVFIELNETASAQPDWNAQELEQLASGIPDAVILRDRGGIESDRFGASTSGQTLLYAPDGKLLFEGGITATRGNIGANAGSRAIEAILKSEIVTYRTTPVFGCGLREHEQGVAHE